jgi:glucose/arabinose dehydrogenase
MREFREKLPNCFALNQAKVALMKSAHKCTSVGVLLLMVAGCSNETPFPEEAGYGANPTLPAPRSSWSPTITVPRTIGWPAGEKPTPAAGFEVTAFAEKLDHPRTLYELPNGDILIAESNAPPKPGEPKPGVPSANRITLLRDTDGDGVAEVRTAFLENLNSNFGMALANGQFYVANADAVVRFKYNEGDTKLTGMPEKVADLPAGSNRHWTKSMVANSHGTKLYIGVGSNSNVAENGMDEEKDRASVLEIDIASGQREVFASGLRNPAGMAWKPQSDELWVSVNERDELGDNLVPDYMTSVKRGAFYGWPYSYYGQNVDARVEPRRPDLVAKAIKPDYALGSHTASLGLTFVSDGRMGADYQGGAIIGQHGSWNRTALAGYRVIFVPFKNGGPAGMPKPLLTGFLNERNEARGRPVGVLVDKKGGLLVADDLGNVVWHLKAR